MKDVFISDSIVYVGVDDKNIDLFESQYVVPNGVSYNSYVILDDKITIMDTVDRRGTEGWLANLKKTLGDKKPYYVVVSHLEPDHAGNLKTLLDLYPDIKVIGNPKTFTMIAQFFDVDLSDDRKVVVGEGDTVNLGTHTLQFFMAPLVHWPEVMVTYDSTDKVLLLMSCPKRSCSPLTVSVNSVPWMQTSHGKTKQDAILSTSLANTAYRFRIF